MNRSQVNKLLSLDLLRSKRLKIKNKMVSCVKIQILIALRDSVNDVQDDGFFLSFFFNTGLF